MKNEKGSALVMLLLAAPLLAALAAALISVSITETLISAAYRGSREVEYAAEAGLARSLHELARISDWNALLLPAPGNATATFSDAATYPVGPGNRPLDLGRLTLERQLDSDGICRFFGANAPQWRLFAHTWLSSLAPFEPLIPPAYLVVWIADDSGETDGAPEHDSNGRLLVYVDAFGPAGTRRSLQAAVEKAPGPSVRVLTWKEIR